jgi:arsenate reductase
LKLEIYTLRTCDTCRKAVKWLRAKQIPFEEIPIREQPPSISELRLALEQNGGDIRKLFNTSGQEYRALNLKESLPTMPEAEALALLASNGNLIKRPFLLRASTTLVGFNEVIWAENILHSSNS